MKQTVVDFIELKLLGLVSFDSEELRKKYKDIFKQAKEMEKEQIIDACKQCSYSYEEAEQYYNETFKSEKQSYQDKMRDKINKAKSRIE